MALLSGLVAALLAADEAPDTAGSDPIVLVVGIVVVTAIAVTVTIRRRSRS